MKAVYVYEQGDPSVIQIGDLPVPEVIPKRVLIKVLAVSGNYVDTFIRSGLYQTQLPQPYILGRDAVGEVVSVGDDVSQFADGDLVWTNSMGYDGRQGVTSEYALIPAERLFSVPEGVDPVRLIGAVHSAATAAIILQDVMQLARGQTLLIEGAAGHVGSKLLCLAHEAGAKVVTTSNCKDFSKLRESGSSACFDYHDDRLFQKLTEHFSTGFDHIIDTSGEIALQTNIDLLALKGVITLITAPRMSAFDAQQLYMNCQQIRGFVISQASLSQLQMAGRLLNKAFKDNLLLEDDIVIKSFDEAAEAHRLLDNKKEKRKIVLVP